MFDVWSVVRWWEDWQLRILVLGSLFLQWFLLLAAPMRKYTIPHLFRTCIWLAYISSDALAIYALATLFNRHAKTSATTSAGSCGGTIDAGSILEVLWAPILLIHLGGQEELTAYEIEDNELWTRHTVTLVSQVAVALYAFYKSWPNSSDWRLLSAAILLFVIGVASFSEKPWALNRAKINRLATVSAWIQGTKERSTWKESLNQFFLFEESNDFTTLRRGLIPTACSRDKGSSRISQKKQVALSPGDKVLMVLSDMSLLAAAKDLVDRNKAATVEDVLPPLNIAEKQLPGWLRRAFAFIYTRATVVVTPQYLIYHLVVVPILHITALTLFAIADKHPYKRADVKITYIILCLTAALDVLAVFIRQLLYRLMSVTSVPALCETVPDYNLVDAVIRESNKATGWIYRCARAMDFTCNGVHSACKSELAALSRRVREIVLVDLMGSRNRDLASYRVFDQPPGSGSAGNWILTTELQEQCGTDDSGSCSNWILTTELQEQCGTDDSGSCSNWILTTELQKKCSTEIRSSMRVSFDRSVLLWHIATDLCKRCTNNDELRALSLYQDYVRTAAGGEEEEDEEEVGAAAAAEDEGGGEGPRGARDNQEMTGSHSIQRHMECANAISDYMAHLLNSHPDMLLTGSRKHLISEAMDEIKSYFLVEGAMVSQDDAKELIDDIAGRNWKSEQKVRDDRTRVFHIVEACKLAKELLKIEDVSTRWTVIYKVWVGMLCYSASMCRGYLHAKGLGEGGEFLSFIWLILSLKGAKTLADKLQLPEAQASGDNPERNKAQDHYDGGGESFRK